MNMNEVSRNDALRLHRDSIIIDGLNASYFFDKEVLESLKKGGITSFNGTIAAWHTLPETMNLMAGYLELFKRHDDLLMPVHKVEDIQWAKATGRIGFILGFQGIGPIGDNIRLLSVYHALGVRIIQLTYNHQNPAGYGCMAPEDKGLTAFGRDIIDELNSLKILIDLSHCGPKTSLETIETSNQPVAFTHVDPAALAKHPRNKSDEALRAIAAKGGVAGVTALPAMLTGQRHATLEDYLAAIDYMVNLMGIDHVGIGPDFMENMPEEILGPALQGISDEEKRKYFSAKEVEGFTSISACPKVTQGLMKRGYPEEAVKKIMGCNWLRLYEDVWSKKENLVPIA